MWGKNGWFSYGSPMVFLWFPYGFSIASLRNFGPKAKFEIVLNKCLSLCVSQGPY